MGVYIAFMLHVLLLLTASGSMGTVSGVVYMYSRNMFLYP